MNSAVCEGSKSANIHFFKQLLYQIIRSFSCYVMPHPLTRPCTLAYLLVRLGRWTESSTEGKTEKERESYEQYNSKPEAKILKTAVIISLFSISQVVLMEQIWKYLLTNPPEFEFLVEQGVQYAWVRVCISVCENRWKLYRSNGPANTFQSLHRFHAKNRADKK